MHQRRSAHAACTYFAVDLCEEEINAGHFTCQCHISLPTGWSWHSLLTPDLSSSTLTANSSIQLLQCWDSKKSETIRIVFCHRFGTNCSQSRCWSLYVWQYVFVCMCVSRQTRLPALPSFASANGTMMPVSDHCNYTFKFLHWCQMLHPPISLSVLSRDSCFHGLTAAPFVLWIRKHWLRLSWQHEASLANEALDAHDEAHVFGNLDYIWSHSATGANVMGHLREMVTVKL